MKFILGLIVTIFILTFSTQIVYNKAQIEKEMYQIKKELFQIKNETFQYAQMAEATQSEWDATEKVFDAQEKQLTEAYRKQLTEIDWKQEWNEYVNNVIAISELGITAIEDEIKKQK